MKRILFLFFVLLIAAAASVAQSKTDSLQTLLKKDIEDTNKVNHLNTLAWEVMNTNPDTSILLSTQALQLAEKKQWKKGIAKSYNQLGWLKYIKGDYTIALENYHKALVLFEELSYGPFAGEGKSGKASALARMGAIYNQQSDYPKALDNMLKALKIFEESGDKNKIATVLGNIGGVYDHQGNYYKALDYYFKAVKMAEELGNKQLKANNLSNIGIVQRELGDYPKALEYYFKALKMTEELGNKNSMATILGNIGMVYYKQADYIKALDYCFKSLKMVKEIGDKNGIASNLGNIGSLYIETKKYAEAEKYLLQSLAICDSIGALSFAMGFENSLSELYAQTGKDKKALEHYKKVMVLKDTLFNQEKNKEITRKEMNYEFDKKEAAAKAEQDKKDAVAGQKLQKQKIIRNSFVGGFGVVLLFSVIVFRQKKKIARGKQRSDELLLNILPSEVAEELKMKGESEAKQFDDVTVLFTDFVNFTGASEKLSPKELVSEIHLCFTAFDEIIGRNGLEKIKTIGDAYLAVCGLPNADERHAAKTIVAAQEILKFMNERKKAFGLKEGFGDVRIGINSGSVVAGIVGVKKFAYDIWGDTVNIAARMEQNCDSGKINISGTTYEIVKAQFTCIHRGKIEAKNKGEIDMYYVEQST